MVRAELREAGIEALGLQCVADMNETLARGMRPSLIVVDGVELENAAARETVGNLTQNVAVLVVDSRTTPAPPLRGAGVLLRPVRVRDIVSRVLARLGRQKTN